MLRCTPISLSYRATLELDRIRGMLRGRARLERKVGLKRLFFLMRTQTRYRVEQQSFWSRAIVRKNVDSAAQEHGTGWRYLRNDLARQNVILLPRTQQMLAQYEPLSFRAVVELCASSVPPPAPPPTAQVPPEVYEPRPEDPNTSHPAAKKELHDAVVALLSTGKSEVLTRDGPRTVDGWLNAWREFDVASPQEK